VKAMSGGRLEIEVLPAGAVVPAFEVLDAVHRQVIDGGHTAAAYWVGKNRAATLFGPAAGGPFGMDMIDYMGWLYDGGGIELYREYYQNQLKRNVVPIPLTSVANQVLGWFKQPIKSWDDLKGRKCRQTGLTAEVFSKSGMSPVNMPGGDIVPAGERGVIECGEWVGPAEDMVIGFQTVWKHYYMPSMHEPATVLELLINGDVWKKLSPDLQQIIQAASWEATFRSQTIMNKRNAEALIELREKHGVKIERTPEDILKKTLEAWDQIAKEEEAKNPFFKKVYDSQRAYASKVVPARRHVYAPYEIGANYYWPDHK
jgi:TRAP-type mannitol/chloroaromatic compound transport system substrate-binding protein